MLDGLSASALLRVVKINDWVMAYSSVIYELADEVAGVDLPKPEVSGRG